MEAVAVLISWFIYCAPLIPGGRGVVNSRVPGAVPSHQVALFVFHSQALPLEAPEAFGESGVPYLSPALL